MIKVLYEIRIAGEIVANLARRKASPFASERKRKLLNQGSRDMLYFHTLTVLLSDRSGLEGLNRPIGQKRPGARSSAELVIARL